MEFLPIIVPIVLLLIFILWVAMLYNNLVRARNHCDESWADIDTELKRRYDLIPNLVETVKGYADHEKEVLDRVVEARNTAYNQHGTPKEQAQAENDMISALRHMFILVENYPDLKANHNFLHLQNELVNTENRIQRARRFYNANVRDLNNNVETFPTNIIASMGGFQTREYFEVEDASIRQAPQVDIG